MTFDVSKFFKFNIFNNLQSKNIEDIDSTNEVLKLDKSNEVNDFNH